MNAEQLEINVVMTNDKVQFSGTSRDNPAVKIDYVPPVGDGQGYTSLELLLISLASCSATSVATLLRKMQKTVSGMEVIAKGIRREQHPTSFRQIFLEFVVNSPDSTSIDMQKALALSEDKICPVWVMLKNSVEIQTNFRIVS